MIFDFFVQITAKNTTEDPEAVYILLAERIAECTRDLPWVLETHVSREKEQSP